MNRTLGSSAIVHVTLGSICTSDLHIKHESVPRAVLGITVGHEMVGVVEEIGTDVKDFKYLFCIKNTYLCLFNNKKQKYPYDKI